MFLTGGASALALLSFISATSAQTPTTSSCPYTPTWVACDGVSDTRLQCATMKVARDWQNNYRQGVSPEIDLRLIRYKADPQYEATAKSIVVNPGGPGGSGIDFVLTQGADRSATSGGRYHIIGFDPRGTGLNMPYSCNPAQTPLAHPGIDYRDTTVFQKSADYFRQAAGNCKDQNEQLGTIMDTIQVAQDVFAISEAVNSDKLIRYMGFSYGTLLGNVIARLFPSRIERMVLDGNVDPNSYFFQSGAQEYTDADKAFLKFFEYCADSATTIEQCKLHGDTKQTYDALVQTFNDFVGNQPTQANRGRASDHPLSPAHSFLIRNLFISTLKAPWLYKDLARVLKIWYDSPGSVRAFCSDEDITTYPKYAGACPTNRKRQAAVSDFNPNNAKNAAVNLNILGIKCLDNRLRGPLTGPQYQAWYNEGVDATKYADDISIIGIFWCAAWQQSGTTAYKSSDPWGNIPNKETILFVQTYYDTVTPKVSADKAKSYYQKSSIVYTDGLGHCSNVHYSDELNKALVKYWATDSTHEIPTTGFEYPVDAPNPFTNALRALPSEPDKTESELVGEETGENAATQPDGTSTSEKRDLLSLFRTAEKGRYNRCVRQSSPYIPKRQETEPGTPFAETNFESCDEISSSSTTSSQSSTSTSSLSTVTSSVTTTSSQSTLTTTSKSSTTTGPTSSGSTSSVSTSSDSSSTTTSKSSVSTSSGSTTSVSTSTGSTSTGSTSTGKVSSTTSVSTSSVSTTKTSSLSFTVPTTSGLSSSSTVSTESQTSTTYSFGITTSTSKVDRPTSTSHVSKPSDSAWNAWSVSSSTTKPKDPVTSTWGPWSSKPTNSWDIWTSQTDCIPVTKTVCADNDKTSCETQVVAVPTKTVYVDYVLDVCPTGLITNTITVTATCTKGCESKPTGVPDGYTTKAVYCSACAQPSTVTVTVKITETATASSKPTAWANVPGSPSSTRPVSTATGATWSSWDGSSAKVTTAAAVTGTGTGTWASWSAAVTGVDASSKPVAGVAAGSDTWSSWAGASTTGSPVAVYRGAAPVNGVAGGSLFAAVFAGLFML